MTPMIVDAQVLTQLEIEQYAKEEVAIASPKICHAQIEIDSLCDRDFGILYRVWQGMNLLGTFYRADSDGKWVAQPRNCNDRPRCNSPEQAQQLILALSGLVAAAA
jgi:hypothetical protein